MSEQAEMNKDLVFEILSSARRRRLLYHLYNRNGVATLRELAYDVAVDETGEPVEDEVEKRLYISLYQTHIPKLEDAGIIEYDSDTREVKMTKQIHKIQNVLESEDLGEERAWVRYYAIVGIAGLALAILITVGFLELSAGIVAGVLAMLLLLVALIHYYDVNFRRGHNFPESLVE